MPKRPLTLPFPQLLILPRSGLITWEWLEPLIQARLDQGVSFCVTFGSGNPKRGGYFFHLRRTADGFEFCTFDRSNVLTLGSGDECATLMNHVSGRAYDEQMWRLCQRVNLRSDEE